MNPLFYYVDEFYFMFILYIDVIVGVHVFQLEIAKAELDLYLSSEQKELTKLEQIKSNYETASRTVEGRKE
jgi:hypothetical protein